MGHADDGLFRAHRSGALNQFIEHEEKTLSALERKTFLADVFGVQIMFQALGRGQPFQQATPHLRRVGGRSVHALQTALDPALFLGIGDMHVFDAHRRRVGGA